MKRMLKTVLAIAAAVFVGNAAVAEDNGATVDLEKSIASTDKSNATIRIVSNVKFSDVIHTNKILLVGSLCDSHGLLAKTVRGTVNKLVTKGSVDWQFFSLGAQTGANDDAKKGVHNSQQMGVELKAGEQTDKKAPDPEKGSTVWPYADEAADYEWKDQDNQRGYLPHSSHKVLKEMLTAVDNAIKGTKEPDKDDPDYIALEFDGSRIGEHYNANATLESRVANKLAWYYNNKRVIWIVDNKASGDKEPYYGEYYRPSSAFLWGQGQKHTMSSAQWEGLVALLDPVTYTNKATGARFTATMKWSGVATSDNDGPSDGTIWAANRNDLQTNYSDLDAIKQLIEDAMKEPIYTAKAEDTAASFGGALSIEGDTEISVYKWTGKSAPVAPSADKYIADATGGWTPISKPDAEVSRDGNAVNVALTNLVNDSWYKVEIKVKATDDLVKNALNTTDPDEKGLCKLSDDGKYYKINPNKGDAKFTLYRDAQDGKGPVEWKSGSAAALNTWDINRPALTIPVKDDSVTYGDDVPTERFGFKDPSEWKCDDKEVDETQIKGLKGPDAVTFGTTYTKGSPVGGGYTINTNSAALSSAYYIITVEPGELTVKPATIKPVKPGENPPEDGSPYTLAPNVERTYDGNGTNITAEVYNVDDTTDVPTFLYSLDENGPFKEWSEISIVNVTNENGVVMSNKVWYTVTTKTAGDDVNYFAATNFAYVKINPRPVTLTAASESWPYDGNEHKTNGWSVTSGSFVTGEGIKEPVAMTAASVITNVGEVANAIDGNGLKGTTGTRLDNYDITLKPGKLMVSRVDLTPDQVWAEDAIKVYDGANKTNIVVKFGAGMDASKFVVEYAADATAVPDEKRTTGFTMVHPGDAPEDSEFSADFKGFQDSCTNKVWFRVRESEPYSEGDTKGNYSNYYGFAWVKIAPRSAHFTFPKAVKPYDGSTTYAQGLATNLIGAADNMVGAEWFDCQATGTFTSPNVGDDENYFHLANVTITGKRNAFKRNYVITYDGDDDQLVPGAITIIPMVIGGVTQPGEAGRQIPVDPTNPDSWTNGALSVVKEYDAKATNIVVKVTKPAAATVYYCYDDGTGKPAGGWKTYADFDGYTGVTNVAPVWYKVEYPNYLPVTNRAFVTITAAPIQSVREGDDPDDPTKPWAQAASVEVWTNDCPSVLGGTNITVDVALYGNDEPTLEYSSDLVSWKTDAEMKSILNHILATQVWCRVSCEPNYVSTNVTAYVYIKSRESKSDDKEAEEEDKLQPNPDKTKPTTEEQTKKVVDAIAANDNRNPGYNPNKPVWDGEGTLSGGDHGIQTDAQVNLKVTSISKLPEGEKAQAERHLADKIAEVKNMPNVDPESVKGRNVDVKLLYTRTYSDGTQVEGMDIGADNSELIPFTISVKLEDDEEILKVTRYHAGVEKKLASPERYELSADRTKLTVYAKTYSEFIVVTGIRTPSPCMGCPWGYKVAIVVRTTVANSVSNVYAHACGCYRKPTVGKLVGYVWGTTEEGVGTCGDAACGCNSWSSGRIALWKAWNGAAYPVESMSMQQIDRIGAMKDRSTAELLWTICPADPGAGNTVGAALQLGGFAKCAHRADGTVAVKNASGFLVGQMFSYCQDSIEQVCGDPIPGEAVASHCWTLCEGSDEEIADQNLTIAYGKWKMVWDSKLVSRIKGKSVDMLVKPTAKYEDNPGTAFGN